jgi:hypothetical protein
MSETLHESYVSVATAVLAGVAAGIVTPLPSGETHPFFTSLLLLVPIIGITFMKQALLRGTHYADRQLNRLADWLNIRDDEEDEWNPTEVEWPDRAS